MASLSHGIKDKCYLQTEVFSQEVRQGVPVNQANIKGDEKEGIIVQSILQWSRKSQKRKRKKVDIACALRTYSRVLQYQKGSRSYRDAIPIRSNICLSRSRV